MRLRDRRVLSNQECCDGCIEQALDSIREIRRTLVDAQTELAGRVTALSAFLELMLAPIRQFLTFAQRLDAGTAPRNEEFWRDPERRQAYFDALETLRWHLSKCVHQLTTIAGGRLPTSIIEYRNGWQAGAYKPRTNEVAER